MADTLPPDILASLAAKRLGFQTSADTAKQQAQQAYNDQLYELGNWNNDQVRNINDYFGSSNLFNSGIRVNEQGRLAKNYGDRQSQLGRMESDSLANIQNQLAQQLQGVDEQQAQYALDFNRTQVQQALADAQNQANAQAMAGGSGQSMGGYSAPAQMMAPPPVPNAPGPHVIGPHAVTPPIYVDPRRKGPQ
jgi:hypothetical protein